QRTRDRRPVPDGRSLRAHCDRYALHGQPLATVIPRPSPPANPPTLTAAGGLLAGIPLLAVPGLGGIRPAAADVLEPIANQGAAGRVEQRVEGELVGDVADDSPQHLHPLGPRNRLEILVDQGIELGVHVATPVGPNEVVLRQRSPRAMEVQEVVRVVAESKSLEAGPGVTQLAVPHPLV